MMDYILNFKFNSLLGIFLYWVPFAFCCVGYTIRTAKNYMKDKKNRDNVYYSPTDTIGTLIGRSIATIIPVSNLWAALFDVAPELFSGLFTWISKVFNTPLVPRKKTEG